LAYGCEAERAIDWGERALRLSPFDRLKYCAYHALAIGNFLRGCYEELRMLGVALFSLVLGSASPTLCSWHRSLSLGV
jgi:hypothetical protein